MREPCGLPLLSVIGFTQQGQINTFMWVVKYSGKSGQCDTSVVKMSHGFGIAASHLAITFCCEVKAVRCSRTT